MTVQSTMDSPPIYHQDGSFHVVQYHEAVDHIFTSSPSKFLAVRQRNDKWYCERHSSIAEEVAGLPRHIYFHNVVYKEYIRLGIHVGLPDTPQRLLLPGETVDHIDRNPLNNLPENLRPATKLQQHLNKSNNNPHPGVFFSAASKSLRKGAWVAQGKDPTTSRNLTLAVSQTGQYDRVCRARDEFMWKHYPEYPNPCPYPHTIAG